MDDKQKIVDFVCNTPEILARVRQTLKDEFGSAKLFQVMHNHVLQEDTPIYNRYYELLQEYCDNA
jgi:hypothetical protein